jgi:hypothetical protein
MVYIELALFSAHRFEWPIGHGRLGVRLVPAGKCARGPRCGWFAARSCLVSNPGKFLSPVQIGITLIGVLSGVPGGYRHGASTPIVWLLDALGFAYLSRL